MRTLTRELLLAAGALLTTVALPSSSRAQASLEPIRVTEARQRADQLDQDAENIERSSWGELGKAASLREQAVDLRTLADPKAVSSLYSAAHDRYYSDDPIAGRRLMEQSAERALAIGDVVGAATALTEAAYIASELRDVERTRTLATRAMLLALSPMLTDEQKAQLRARFGNDLVLDRLLARAARA